jgi:hypothetical protein
MIRSMDDIYDVFRLLVNACRGSLIDTDIARALEIIDKHAEAALAPAPPTPSPDPGSMTGFPADPGGDSDG